MALDPTIANPAALKLNDPLEQYGSFLTNALMMDKMDEGRRKRNQDTQVNALMKKHVRPDGTTDRAAARYDLAQNELGAMIPGMEEEWGKGDKLAAETGEINTKRQKTRVEAMTKIIDLEKNLYQGLSPSRDQGVKQLLTGLYSIRADQDMVDLMGGPEGVARQFESDLRQIEDAYKGGDAAWQNYVMSKAMGLKDASEKVYNEMNLGNRMVTTEAPKHAMGQVTPRQTGSYTIGKSPNGPAQTNITVHAGQKGADKQAETIAEGRGKRFIEMENAAAAAHAQVSEIDNALDILNRNNAMLGAGSPAMLNLVRYAKAAGMTVNDEALVDTEQLTRFFAQNTLQNVTRFKQMGMSLTPMSDSDRAIIERASVQGTNDPETIRKVLTIQRREAQKMVNAYLDYAQQLKQNPTMGPVMDMIPGQQVKPVPERAGQTHPGEAALYDTWGF